MANMGAVAQLADSIVAATAALHNPGSSQQQRGEAVKFFEQVCARGGRRRDGGVFFVCLRATASLPRAEGDRG